jgi:asparagine synthase (glutamine-hydrolysing)
MCGVAAIFARRGEVCRDALVRARDALRHRGPDEEGVWVSVDRQVGLAHTRLSIIDLTSGQQPIGNEDGSIQAIVNGELYDFERTQRQLEARGHRLRSRSDSEILVHLYEEYGAHAVQHIRGEYAFILWDHKRRLLLAGRDRFGIKPLVYAQIGDQLYIASEAKSLFAAGVPARWDHESVIQSCFVSPADRTLFADVFNIPPAGVLRATESSLNIDRYWDLDFPSHGGIEISEPEAVNGVRSQLETAVRRRLRADVPVGIYLSGGLDSCAVQGVAARLGQKLTGYTIAFEDDPQPEALRAQEMAAYVGSSVELLPITQQALADSFAASVRSAECMVMNAHGTAKYLLSRFVHDRGLKVVLTGEGADEMFAGYPAMRYDAFRERAGTSHDAQDALQVLRATNPASVGLSLPSGVAPSPRVDRVRAILGSAPAFFEANSETSEQMLSLFKSGPRGRDTEANPFLTLIEGIDVRAKLAGRDAVQRSLYLYRATLLPTYVLTVLGDKAEMAHSVEGRVPFLDHELAEYVARIPSSLMIQGDIEKKVLREAVRDLVPDSIYRREKHPLRAPVGVSGPMWNMLQDVVHSDAVKQLTFLDRGRVRALAAVGPNELNGPAAINRHCVVLTRLASLCALQEAFHLT